MMNNLYIPLLQEFVCLNQPTQYHFESPWLSYVSPRGCLTAVPSDPLITEIINSFILQNVKKKTTVVCNETHAKPFSLVVAQDEELRVDESQKSNSKPEKMIVFHFSI